MIKNTFLMLDGVGEKTEKLLWQKGILSWDDFMVSDRLPRSIGSKRYLFNEMLTYFTNELSQDNEKPFAEFIKKSDHWRLYDHFKESAICLDIETNGLPASNGGDITVVGLYDHAGFRQYVKGVNLTEDAIFSELSSSKLLISFYGSVFDMPFLSHHYRSLADLTIPHFDLCFAGRRAGLSGGLKKIEAHLGLKRDDSIDLLNGYDAVKLWGKWENGDRDALETLLYYNEADTVNLMHIANIIYDRLFEKSGFSRFHAKFSDQ
ncbi:MAG: ribonuclease H-like domain-containing protein [Nitrospirota bacterium]|nr:MAG: ribonuclease H-like domain-containing protein [Nitrospirota bacterium]